jgi:D-arabinose 1-dehydrogenase-like Zn-dependent alcohol dehydrogenase
MATMRAMQVGEKGGDFELVEREVPTPGRGEVLVRVHACGVCHSDMVAKEGVFPGVPFPIVPGHEIAGEIAELGEGVNGWSRGQRVGVGWFGGNCGWCDECRRGDFIACHNMGIPGVTFDGGYADYVLVRSSALAAIPDDLADEDAAPLLCAGITTYNALRNSAARGGDLVAILGVGGLGHLGIQFAAKLGFRPVAIARGTDKEQLARELGARDYIDSTAGNPGEALQGMGGAKVILSTISSGAANTEVIEGLGPDGELIVVGASPDPIEASPIALIAANRTISGHASGSSMDSQDTLAFSSLTGVRPRIETLPLEKAGEAYAKMLAGDARFRMVLTTGAGD